MSEPRRLTEFLPKPARWRRHRSKVSQSQRRIWHSRLRFEVKCQSPLLTAYEVRSWLTVSHPTSGKHHGSKGQSIRRDDPDRLRQCQTQIARDLNMYRDKRNINIDEPQNDASRACLIHAAHVRNGEDCPGCGVNVTENERLCRVHQHRLIPSVL